MPNQTDTTYKKPKKNQKGYAKNDQDKDMLKSTAKKKEEDEVVDEDWLEDSE